MVGSKSLKGVQVTFIREVERASSKTARTDCKGESRSVPVMYLLPVRLYLLKLSLT